MIDWLIGDTQHTHSSQQPAGMHSILRSYSVHCGPYAIPPYAGIVVASDIHAIAIAMPSMVPVHTYMDM